MVGRMCVCSVLCVCSRGLLLSVGWDVVNVMKEIMQLNKGLLENEIGTYLVGIHE